MDAIFVGNYTYAIDAQRRVPLHKDWRAGDEPSFVLVPGRDRTILALPVELFRETVLSKAKQVSIGNAAQMNALALIGSKAHFSPVDKQGRIKLSPELMEHAGIVDQVVMVGSVSMIQLHAPAKWGAKDTDTDTFLDEYDKMHEQGKVG